MGVLVILLAGQALVFLMMNWQTRSAARDGHMRPEPPQMNRSFKAQGQETRFCDFWCACEAVCSQRQRLRVLMATESVV